jgi:hypothetical protein
MKVAISMPNAFVRTKTSPALAGILIVAGLLAPRVALAAPTEAEAALAQGVAAFKHHDYDTARRSFQRSYDLTPRTSTLLNLGLAELNSDHPLDAIKHLRAFVRASDAPAAKVDEVRSNVIPRVEAQLGRIEIDAPSGAQILVDGVRLGIAPLSEPADVLPGAHEVAAMFDDGRSSRTTVTATAGEVARAHIVSAEPIAPPILAPADPPAPQNEPAQAPRSSMAKKITVIALGSGAAVSLGLGIAFGVISNHDKNEADMYRQGLGGCAPTAGQPLPPTCTLLANAVGAQGTNATLAHVFYASGAVLAVGAVASWLLWPNAKPSDGHAWVLPMIGRSNGVAFGASF